MNAAGHSPPEQQIQQQAWGGEDDQWFGEAACRGRNAELFFHPDRERGPSRAHRVARAKEVCATCPVKQQCLEHALSVPEVYGIWGGMDEHERADLTRAAAC